jgi:hypothetical protein
MCTVWDKTTPDEIPAPSARQLLSGPQMETSRKELRADIYRWREKILQLPTPESRTMEWLQMDRIMREKRGAHRCDLRMWLECDGFSIYLQTKKWEQDANLVRLTLGNVTVPEQHRRKGWFKLYANMCFAMMPHAGLIVETVTNPELFNWLSQQPGYERVDRSFLRRKSAVMLFIQDRASQK